MRGLLLLAVIVLSQAGARPLVVVSVDGLDNRYLTGADRMGLKIPNIRRLMREGQVSAGVIGVVPTVTWPSHTTMITGVDPVVHGILANWRPPGEKYLEYSQIHASTLIGAAHDAGKKIASVNWPVTVGAPIDWNIPEYFQKRRGASMDMESIEKKVNPPNLIEMISADEPSLPREFMDDRARTLATTWILQHHKPDLMLLHLAELDSEQHENAPYSRPAKATLEYLDELIGKILEAMPKESVFALVSDHGFEQVNTVVNLESAAAAHGVKNLVQSGGMVVAPDARAAEVVRELAKDPKYGIGREIPKEERAKFPSTIDAGAAAVFEPRDGFMFAARGGPEFAKPAEIGNHGHWPMRYRAVFMLWGSSISHKTLPEVSMKEHAGKFAELLGVQMAKR